MARKMTASRRTRWKRCVRRCGANATAEIVVYPHADHAFNADYRASYHEESAKDGWQRMLAWFAQYGGKRG
jgi:carboxymethylenebutenolidase